MSEKQRTSQQNNALHLYCEMMATALNDAGLDMRTVLKPEIEIPWTKESVKKQMWTPIQEIMFNKESTTEPSTVEYTQIYDVINRNISEKWGVTVLWPHHSMQGFDDYWSKQ